MDSTFGLLDVIAFLVFAVLITAAIIIIVFLGQLPGRLARQMEHPRASAIAITSWLGLATLGLLWPIALIWVFVRPSSSFPPASRNDQTANGVGKDAGHEPSVFEATPIKRVLP
jgi:hypothetical protein